MSETKKELLFLFPETVEMNPFSFLRGAVRTTQEAKTIRGFRLYTFLDRLDEACCPFYVVPVPRSEGSVSMYQFKYSSPDEVPKFEALGLSTKVVEGETVVYAESETLISVYGSISVKDGDWNKVGDSFRELAAAVHLDLIPRLSHIEVRKPELRADVNEKLTKFYNIGTFRDLYVELFDLLSFFGFTDKKEGIIEGECYCFGQLREPVRKFHRKCFPNKLQGNYCITPAIVKELRACKEYVRCALSKILEHEVGESLGQIKEAVHEFQRENDLQEDIANEETMRKIWTKLLSGTNDPQHTLLEVGVRLNQASDYGDSKIILDSVDGREEISQRIEECIKWARREVRETEEHLLKVAKGGADSFTNIHNEVQRVGKQVKDIQTASSEIEKKVQKEYELAQHSEDMMRKLVQINEEMKTLLPVLKERIDRERSRTRYTALAFFIVVFLLIAQHLRK